MIRLYLAGPMTGLPDLNFPAFHAEAARLRALGYDVVNPAEINGGADELVACAQMTPAELKAHWRKCMRADIKQLVDCDGVALLPGWQKSKGARIEADLARNLGMSCEMADEYVDPLSEPATPVTDWAAA